MNKNFFNITYECKACGHKYDDTSIDKPETYECDICDDFWCNKCVGDRTFITNKYGDIVCSDCKN